jgi:TatD DNase family protein
VILTDTHCHLDLEAFQPDRPEVLRRAGQAGVRKIMIPALNLPSSRKVVELSASDPMLYAAVGVHPQEAHTFDEAALPELRRLAGQPRVMAIGEIGLDYYWDGAPHPVQQRVLAAQLDLARELNLPVILHMREKGDAEHGECAEDMLRILSAWAAGSAGAAAGVLHSFSGSPETARRTVQLGLHIGVTGPVTYRNAPGKREVVRGLPLERLLLETDAPFMAPVPERGKRNEPAFVAHIADKIGEVTSRTAQEVAAVTTGNAARLFSWGDSLD